MTTSFEEDDSTSMASPGRRFFLGTAQFDHSSGEYSQRYRSARSFRAMALRFSFLVCIFVLWAIYLFHLLPKVPKVK